MRHGTSRFILLVLTAILLAFLLPAPIAPFASAGSAAHTQESSPGSPDTYTADAESRGTPQAGPEYAPCSPPAPEGDPNGLLNTRDRHRTVVQSTPDTLSRCLVTGGTAGRPPAAAPVTPAHAYPLPRSSASHSPAVLQVFRC